MNLHDFFTDVLLIIWRMRKQYFPGLLACIEATTQHALFALYIFILNLVSGFTLYILMCIPILYSCTLYIGRRLHAHASHSWMELRNIHVDQSVFMCKLWLVL